MTNLQYNIGAPRPIPDVYRFAGGAEEVVVMDFVNDRGLSRGTTDFNDDASSHVTSTHADAILMLDENGDYVSKAANVVMQEDGVGLQATIDYNNTTKGSNLSAAVVGVVGSGGVLPTGWVATGTGLTTEVVAKGTLDGLPYIDIRFSSSSITTFFGMNVNVGTNVVPVVPGDKVAIKFGIQVIAGNLPPALRGSTSFVETSGVNGAVIERVDTFWYSSFLDDVLRFHENVFTVTDADTTSFWFRPFMIERAGAFGNVLTLDVTLRIVAVQAAISSKVGPFIGTGSSTVSAAGNIEKSVLDPFDNGVCGFIKVNVKALPDVDDCLLCISDGTINNQIKLACNGANWVMVVNAGGVNYASVAMNAITVGEKTFVFAVGPNYCKARLVGGTDPAADTTVTYPVTCDEVSYGGDGITTANNTYIEIREVTIRNIAGSEAILDAIYDDIALLESMTAPANLAAQVL